MVFFSSPQRLTKPATPPAYFQTTTSCPVLVTGL